MKCWFGSQCKDTNIFGSQRVNKNVGKLTSRDKKWHTFTNWFPGALVGSQGLWLAPRSLCWLAPKTLVGSHWLWLVPRGLVGSQEPWLIGSHGPWMAPRGLGCLLGALVERIPCSCLWSIAVTCTYTTWIKKTSNFKSVKKQRDALEVLMSCWQWTEWQQIPGSCLASFTVIMRPINMNKWTLNFYWLESI